MSIKPISDKELDRLLDMAADVPDYNHEKLLAKITAQIRQTEAQHQENGEFVLIALLQRPFWTAGIAVFIAALGAFTGLESEMLYREMLTTSLILDTPIDFHTSLLLI